MAQYCIVVTDHRKGVSKVMHRDGEPIVFTSLRDARQRSVEFHNLMHNSYGPGLFSHAIHRFDAVS
jgi:hypothetical protein